MLVELIRADIETLRYLNVVWAHPLMDQFWRGITQMHKQLWFQAGILPLIMGWGFYMCKWQFVKVLIAVGLAVGLADLIAYRGIKSMVSRPRPFQNAEISNWVRPVGEAHGSSFPSNHAANCFAGAGVLSWYFHRSRYYFYSLAALIAISRPALGVHYPSDVLAGMILGLIVAAFVKSVILNPVSWFWVRLRVSYEDDQSTNWRARSGRQF